MDIIVIVILVGAAVYSIFGAIDKIGQPKPEPRPWSAGQIVFFVLAMAYGIGLWVHLANL